MKYIHSQELLDIPEGGTFLYRIPSFAVRGAMVGGLGGWYFAMQLFFCLGRLELATGEEETRWMEEGLEAPSRSSALDELC